MDRATENLVVRTSGSFALAAMLIVAGFRVGLPDTPEAGLAGLYLLPFFLVALAGNWALSRLNVKRPALIATVVLLGVVPVLLALPYHWYVFVGGPGRGIVLALLVFGAVTTIMGGMMLVKRGATATEADAQAG